MLVRHASAERMLRLAAHRGVGSLLRQHALATANQLAEIGFVAPKLKDAMQRAGDAMIGFQPIDSMNKPNFFRLVLPNPRHLSKDMLRDMLDRMDELGKDL